MYRQIEIGKYIKGEELEEILIKAAGDVGLKAISKDKFVRRYVLGSIQEKDFYEQTEIELKGRFLQIAKVSGVRKGANQSWFSINFDSNKARVEGYLNAVSAYI